MFGTRQVIAILVTSVAVGCIGSEPAIQQPDLVDGKADGEDACQTAHDDWLGYQYAPVTCEDGPSCVGLAAIETAPSCKGAPKYSWWRFLYDRHVHLPWLLRRNAATAEFILRDSPHFGDHEKFVAALAPTPEEQAAHDKMIAITTAPVEAYEFDYDWLQSHYFLLYEFGTPVERQGSSVINKRGMCGVHPDVQAPCPDEPPLFLNSSELTMLAWSLQTAPSVRDDDGAFARWTKPYFDLLTPSALSSLQFEFPLFTGLGLASYELEFYAAVRSSAPAARGPTDSADWLRWYLVFLETVRFTLSDDVLQLDLFEASRPAQLVGLPAYELWLGTGPNGDGFGSISKSPEHLDRLLANKPCARDEVELSDMQAVWASFVPAGETADLALAEPERCQ
ncbi:MAG: hypothetical protein AB7O24_24745 [Kofleriaceae bacterium]